MEIEKVFKEGKFFLREDHYLIIKSSNYQDGMFAVIDDGNEITLIAPDTRSTHEKLLAKHVLAMDNEWRLITFDMKLPFELVGFISGIASALAAANISIFVISSFSTDHLMVKQDKLMQSLKILEELGLTKV